jgi:hypothetical protein
MMEFLKVFDAYSLRARLFPAIIACAPALAALSLLISWKSFDLSNAIATLGILVLLFAIADFARARGRIVERKMYAESGGIPSVLLFRRADLSIDEGSKERYRAFLGGKLGTKVPTSDEETQNQADADKFYEQCGVWLREQTRDTKKFPLVFGENVAYGFRRNLFGLKTLGLGLNAIVVAACLVLLWLDAWVLATDFGRRVTVVLVVAVFHAGYMLLAARKALAWDAANAYGRQLILSCEALLLGGEKPAKRPAAPRKKAVKKPAAQE